MEEQKDNEREETKKRFIDDSELDELSDDKVVVSKEKEIEIEKKLEKFRKENPIEYEE